MNDPSASFHRVPKEQGKRTIWLNALAMCEEEIKPNIHVCCRHFPEGDTSKVPSLKLGKRFASPMKKGHRAKRAKVRDEDRQVFHVCQNIVAGL